MTSYLTYHDDTVFDIEDYPMEKLRSLIEGGGILFWSMNGLLGKLPNPVLADALRLNEAVGTAKERNRFLMHSGDGPWLIHWHQTVTPQDPVAAWQRPLLHPTQP